MRNRGKAGVKEQRAKSKIVRLTVTLYALCSVLFSSYTAPALAEDLDLQSLIDEALKHNHEILMSEFGIQAAEYKIPQAESLPDPMFMFGYMNEGTDKLYTFGDEMAADSQWMFSVSQMFPYPGKLSLKKDMAQRDAESVRASAESIRLRTAAKVKELYYELLFAYKNMDLLKESMSLFSRIEDAAIARYSTGMGLQQEVIMAQTEKYMLLESEEMLNQRIKAIEAMLNSVLGRDVTSALGRPSETLPSAYEHDLKDLIAAAVENSPEIKAKEKMYASAETKVLMAEREYYPDFTINAGYFLKGADFPDMWNLTASMNIPLFYKSKQRQAVREAESSRLLAEHEIEGAESMLSSDVQDNYFMYRTSGKLMDLYMNGLIPKIEQDFESALAGYTTGKIEAMTVISRLKAFIDYKILYWKQFAEREKAIARLEALTTIKAM